MGRGWVGIAASTRIPCLVQIGHYYSAPMAHILGAIDSGAFGHSFSLSYGHSNPALAGRAAIPRPIVPTPLATPTPSARTAASAVSAAYQAAGFRGLDNPAAQAHEDVKSSLKGVEREAPPRRQRERRFRSGADKSHE